MRTTLCAGLLLIAGAAEAAEPQFSDFPAGPIYSGRGVAPVLDSEDAKEFRTRLRDGARQPVNFAGHYALVEWGCGTGCARGAVVDKLTGRVTFFPSVCCTAHETGDESTIVSAANSNLLLLIGQAGDSEVDAKNFYRFNGKVFTLIATLPFPPARDDVKESPLDCKAIQSDIARLDCFDKAAGRR